MNEKKVRFRHIEDMKEFVSAACRCDFDIDIVSDRLVVDGKSILGVLSLSCDQDLHVRYDGMEPHFEEVLGNTQLLNALENECLQNFGDMLT